MTRHRMCDIGSITLVVKAESMDRALRVDHREPSGAEARLYGSIVAEFERRHEYDRAKIYRERYNSVYARSLTEER